MRYSFVKTLVLEAHTNKDIIVLTGDLGFTVFEEFREKFPNRFINVGVAEQNMMGVASGLALSGKIVFAYSIATFATMRAFEQIRNDIASHNLPVIVVGSGAGLSYSDASITHHAIEDINLMRGIPGMIILCPADPVETVWTTKLSIRLKKPVYLRLGKKGEPVLHTKKDRLSYGKGSILKKGKDVIIFSFGPIMKNVLYAANLLEQKKISSTVISIHTLKPIDQNLIKHAARTYRLIITVEEHSIIGGLGSCVAEILAQQQNSSPLLILGIPDKFLLSTIGSQESLREKIGLSPQKIANSIVKKIRLIKKL